MFDDNGLDRKIAGLLRSVDRDVPPALEARIRAAAERAATTGGLSRKLSLLPVGLRRRRLGRAGGRRRLRILALVPGAAAAVALVVFLLVPALRRSPAHRISEIRTEFEIPDKNIKIVFFQRPDFKLFQEE